MELKRAALSHSRQFKSIGILKRFCESRGFTWHWECKFIIESGPHHAQLQSPEQQSCTDLKERFEKYGYSTWIDKEDMGDELLSSMALAVNNSAVVVLCYSEEYQRSISCRQEATFAFKRKKPLVFVRVQEKFDPDGWLGILMMDAIYYDLSTPAKCEANLPGLFEKVIQLVDVQKRIESEKATSKSDAQKGAGTRKSSIPTASAVQDTGHTPMNTSNFRNPKRRDWTVEEVATWLK